ncbi:MAG: hypothetical protein GF398_17740 [Chitinivibrionales bacterium]|nr:hypothetical protein [Chitinivibrionales bacterium]
MLARVKQTLSDWLGQLPLRKNIDDFNGFLFGKMLRTRLAVLLMDECADEGFLNRLTLACAATEIAHTASLFHDDVIDGASLRRGRPTLWKATTPNASILTGDFLLCESLRLLAGTGNTADVNTFVLKVREVCFAEAEQELLLRGKNMPAEKALQIARSKTGPLFAFPLMFCVSEATEVLEEVGYLIGTAYQLKDDILDVTGNEQTAGKTLGTDMLRSKYTLAVPDAPYPDGAQDYVEQQCSRAVELLSPWPIKQQKLQAFVDEKIAQQAV